MPAKTFRMTEAQYTEGCDEDGGICLACGERAYGVEPDARGYDCEECGQPRVYGLEEALMMGHIEFTS
jgi:hypothetical protein